MLPEGFCLGVHVPHSCAALLLAPLDTDGIIAAFFHPRTPQPVPLCRWLEALWLRFAYSVSSLFTWDEWRF